ncbi:MAG: glycosyltransferase family 2 protein [Pseudonocardiaceae bacterium]
MTGSLAEALAACDNDYRGLVAELCRRTGLGWHNLTPPTAAAGTRLSVVIPARNTDHSLATVLDALHSQRTSGVVEVIVIDDASSDDTSTIAADHPAVDLAYRLPHQVGAAAARNLGTHLAQAATVVYLDADMVLAGHVLADIAARAHPELVLVGVRHNIVYQDAGHQRARIPEGEPDLDADHRVRWSAPAGVPMFYSGQVYPQSFIGRPLEHTREFLDLGHAAMYHDWDLPRMVVTALVAAPRAAVLDVGGFDAGFDQRGWGTEDTHLGAALIAAGCKVTPLRQVRGFHIDPPDVAAQWQTKFATAATRIDYYRRLLNQPAPSGRAGELARRAERLLHHAEDLR